MIECEILVCAKPSPFVGLLSIFEKQQKCVDRECQNVGFAPGMYGQFAEVSLLRADIMCSKSVHLLEKHVINMISLLLPVFRLAKHHDWSRWFAISSFSYLLMGRRGYLHLLL
jgi:hypothetical protein